MKRKLISIVASAALLATALAGCGTNAPSNTSSNTSSNASSAKVYRVAFIARAQSDSFAAWLCNEMKDAAKGYPDIKLDIYDGQANDDTENSMIENAISNKYDGIIVQANNNTAQAPYIQKVVAAGIKVITTNPRVDVQGASYVDSDPYQSASTIATYALKKIPQNAQVVVLNGPAGNFHATERRKAWTDVFFNKRPDVKIVGEDIANWNKDEAMRLMEDWIVAHPKIDAVISMNDNMAAGAYEAVKDNQAFNNMQIYGSDGTPEGCLLVQQGKLTASILQSAIDLGQMNIKAIHDLMTGAKPNVQVVIGNPLITKDTVQQYLDMYKQKGLIK